MRTKRTITFILSIICYLGALIIGVPLIIGIICWPKNYDMHVTLYIFLAYLAFFFVFLGIIIPFIRGITNFLKISVVNKISDVIVTILIIIVSFFPVLILFSILKILFSINKIRESIRYKIMDVAAKNCIVFAGIIVETHGKRSELTCLNTVNHSSFADYFLTAYTMGPRPWSALAGINLPENTKTLEDKIVYYTIGPLIKEYLITVKRGNKISEAQALEQIFVELEKGKNVAIFSEGGRTLWEELTKGTILRKFKPGSFKKAWEKNVPVQPIVFDWPVIWRGKDDRTWGIHPCKIDIYYLPVIFPKDYESPEGFVDACWQSMYHQLQKSKKIKRFLKHYNASYQEN